jgi:predicted phage terminase large subunit-like protein
MTLHANLKITDFTPEEIQELYAVMTIEERQEFDILLRNSPPRALMPHQAVPIDIDWWEVYLLVGGRGVGKTVAGAYEARNHLRRNGKLARIGIGAPTNADARDTCMEGQTGLITMFPNEFLYYNRSLGEARHIMGGFVKAMGTEKPKRWNGPQWSMLWFDELALCNQEAWDDANLGLRIPGPRGTRSPYAIGTTTPKNRKWVKKLAGDKTTYVPQYIDDVTGKYRLPTTFDNKFLPQRRVDWLKNKYGGSRIGRQELEGIFVDDIDGAMWKRSWIDNNRQTDPKALPRMVRIVIAIDPAGSAARKKADQNALTEDQRANQQKNAQTAIAAMGLGEDGRLYLLAIKADWWSPTEWGMQAIKFFHQYRADRIIAEQNYGGAMVESNIRMIDEYDRDSGRKLVGRHLPIKLVVASRGKDIRAEPICTLYEQGKVVHCHSNQDFAAAEDQMCAFIDAEDNEGADMVDAVVWAGIELGGMDIGPTNMIITPGDPRMRAHVVM